MLAGVNASRRQGSGQRSQGNTAAVVASTANHGGWGAHRAGSVDYVHIFVSIPRNPPVRACERAACERNSYTTQLVIAPQPFRGPPYSSPAAAVDWT